MYLLYWVWRGSYYSMGKYWHIHPRHYMTSAQTRFCCDIFPLIPKRLYWRRYSLRRRFLSSSIPTSPLNPFPLILTWLLSSRPRMGQMETRDLHCTPGRRDSLSIQRGPHRRNSWLSSQGPWSWFSLESWLDARTRRRYVTIHIEVEVLDLCWWTLKTLDTKSYETATHTNHLGEDWGAYQERLAIFQPETLRCIHMARSSAMASTMYRSLGGYALFFSPSSSLL